ncbi:MAG: Sec-independent protein translocase subunit TatA [Micromonosporaceae bacterium]
MGIVKPWHIIVLVVVLILLFGAKRLPDAARGLGRSLRILKAETKNLTEDDVDAKAEAQHSREPRSTIEGEPVDRTDDTPSAENTPSAEKQRDR